MDDKSKKCLREVLTKELEDLKIRARMMEDAYKEDDEEVAQKLKEIHEMKKCIDDSINSERKRLKRKIDISAPIFVIMTPLYMMVIAGILSSFDMSIEIALVLTSITSIVLVPSSYFVYSKYQENKSNKIILSYMKDKQLLCKDEKEYLDIVDCSLEEYLKSCSLVTEKKKEIAKLDDIDVTYEILDDKDENIVEERPYTRKLERK